MHCDEHKDWLVVYVGPMGSVDCPLCDADEKGPSSKDVDNLVEVLGVAAGDDPALSRVTVLASELRVRLGGVLQSLTGDGCDDFAEGVQDLARWLKKGDAKELALSVLGPQDTDQSLSELLELALAERPYQEVSTELGLLRRYLIQFTGRDLGTDLTTMQILECALTDYERECERRQAVQDRVHALLLRLVGECGEGLSTETMLDRIEAALGPVPEF